jgi:hypothetical protein
MASITDTKRIVYQVQQQRYLYTNNRIFYMLNQEKDQHLWEQN